MTNDEEDRIIAEMVRERRELKRSLVCLEEKLRRAENGFYEATKAVRSFQSKASNNQIHPPEHVTYPDIEEFRGLLKNIESARARIQEIDTALNAC